MTVIIRGSISKTYGGAGWDTADTIGLPSGTQVGDWAYVVGNGADFTVTKSGFTRAAALDIVYNTLYPGHIEAWVGQTADLSAVTYTVKTTSQSDAATVTIVTSPNRPNLSRVSTVTATTDAFTLPGVPGRGAGGIALGGGIHGVGSTTWSGSASFPTPNTLGQYWVTAWAKSDDATIGSQPSSWNYSAGETASGLVVIGVGGFGEAPPCQNFPRDDRLGIGAAQNYPPPKSQQGGHRNFGYW